MEIKLREIKFTIKFLLTFIKYVPKALLLVIHHGSFQHSSPLNLAVDRTGEILELISIVRLDDVTKKIYENIITGETVEVRS